MNNFTLETKHTNTHAQAAALASMQMYAASGACNLQHFTMDRERERDVAKRVHSSMANKPRQKCCPSVASLPARAAAEREIEEREI